MFGVKNTQTEMIDDEMLDTEYCKAYRDDPNFKKIVDSHDHTTGFNEAWDSISRVRFNVLRRFAEPIEALQPVEAQAPLEVEEASEAHEPLDAPQTDIGEAQPEALDIADAQPRAEDPEVGAQAPVEVAEDVDVHAQEVADAQATANVNLVAGDDDVQLRRSMPLVLHSKDKFIA
ncbi:unnamed protein product [Aphanomyces euteiches]